MSDEFNDIEQPYYDPEWLKEYVREYKDTGSKIVEIYMEGFEDGKKEIRDKMSQYMYKEAQNNDISC